MKFKVNNDSKMFVNMFSNIVAFVVNIGITFVLTPYIVTKLGSEAYSYIAISSNFVSIATIFTIALNSMASRFISIEINAHRIEKANEYFSSVFIANILLSICLTVPSILCVFFLDYIINIPTEMLVDVELTFIFVFINIIISVLGNVFSVATFARNRLDLNAIRLIIGNLIRGVVTLGLFVFFDPKIYFVNATVLLVTIYTTIANINYTKKLLPGVHISLRKFRMKAIKTLLSSGIWNSLNQLSNVLLNQLDVLLANILVGAVAGGQYALTKTIPSFMLLFISMITSVFLPKFIILYANNKSRDLVDNISSSMKILSLLISLPLGFLLVFGDAFFKLWVPGEDAEYLNLLSQITLISLVVTSNGNMISNVYTITNKLKFPALVALISGILKIILIFIILKTTNFGVLVIPVVSTMVSVITYLTLIPVYAAKTLNVKSLIFFMPILKSVVCTVNMVILCISLRALININSWFSLFMLATISAIITSVINFLVVYSKKERKQMIKQLIRK